MILEIFILAGLMLLPFIELRVGIPLGILVIPLKLPFGIQLIGFGLNPGIVFILAICMGLILGFILFNFWNLFGGYLQKSKFSKRYIKMMNHAQKKVHPYIEKYGVLGLAIYILLPLPGTGIYIGSFGAYALGLEKKKFYLSLMLGVIFAATIVTTLTVLGKFIF